MPGGRPREFDEKQALVKAMDVFWEQGYEGASLVDLTAAMGINRPSLYAAFGSKEGLFRRALEAYVAGPADYVRRALEQPNVQDVVEHLLRDAVKLITDPKHPGGCMLVQSGLTADCAAVEAVLARQRAAAYEALRARFVTAKSMGDWKYNWPPQDAARFLATVLHGMAVQAASGATRKDLNAVAEIARVAIISS